MIAEPTRRLTLYPSENGGQTSEKAINKTDRVLSLHIILHPFGQKQNLRAINSGNMSDGEK